MAFGNIAQGVRLASPKAGNKNYTLAKQASTSGQFLDYTLFKHLPNLNI